MRRGEAKGSPLHATVTVAAREPASAESLADAIGRALGAPDPAPQLVPTTFWARSPHGPRSMPKLIAAPLGEEIAGKPDGARRAFSPS